MMHWAAQYIGRPYSREVAPPEAFNCWSLVAWVQEHHFGRRTPFWESSDLPGILARAAAANEDRLATLTAQYGYRPTDVPDEGDVIMLWRSKAAPPHVGVWADGGLLHCLEGAGVVWSRLNLALRMEYPIRRIYTHA